MTGGLIPESADEPREGHHRRAGAALPATLPGKRSLGSDGPRERGHARSALRARLERNRVDLLDSFVLGRAPDPELATAQIPVPVPLHTAGGAFVIDRFAPGEDAERIFAAHDEGGSKTARAFVCASGSAGTLAAGDHLKRSLGTRTCVVEALECPTLLYNGYGEHNIQGIGDKHVPLIHNVMGTDFVIGISDRASDALNVVFNTVAGRSYLSRHRHVGQQSLAALGDLGLSSIANVLGAIKYAKYMALGPDDIVLTVATDGAEMYHSEIEIARAKQFARGFSEVEAAQAFGQHLLGAATDHVSELGRFDRERIFNLGYYTWVEQQGTRLDHFDERRDNGSGTN